MSEYPVYRCHDYTEAGFPFKLEVRDIGLMNRKRHAHDHLQICYITRGSCDHIVSDKSAVLVKGDIFVIPPYQEHHLIPIPGMEIELVQIDFSPSFINEQMGTKNEMECFIDYAYIQPFIKAPDELTPKLIVSLENRIVIETLIESMKKELRDKKYGYKLSIKADLLKFLIIVGREYKDYLDGRREKQVSAHQKLLHDTIEYMREHYQDEMKLETIAERASMSPTYFSFVFKHITGRNYIDHLNDIRIQKATELLHQSVMSITEVGLAVGYNHLGHFIRMFKKYTAVTPSQYRKTGVKQIAVKGKQLG